MFWKQNKDIINTPENWLHQVIFVMIMGFVQNDLREFRWQLSDKSHLFLLRRQHHVFRALLLLSLFVVVISLGHIHMLALALRVLHGGRTPTNCLFL